MSNYTFLLGMMVSVYKEYIISKTNGRRVIGTIVLFGIFSIVYEKYSHIWLIYFVFKNLAAVFWELIFIELAWYIRVESRIFQILGKASLYLYVVHMNILTYLEKRHFETCGVLVLSLCVSFVMALILDWLYQLILKLKNHRKNQTRL